MQSILLMEAIEETFVKPSVQAPRRSSVARASLVPNTNLVNILSESKDTQTITDDFRLVLASIRYFVTNVKPNEFIPPLILLPELSKVTSLLIGFNEVLVAELLKCKVFELNNEILTEYLKLLVEMCRTHAFYHQEISKHLLSALLSLGESEETGDSHLSSKADLFHGSLRQMIGTLPYFPENFIKSLSRNLPFMTKPCRTQVYFYENILRIVDYVSPELSREILSRIVHKIIDLDCHCPKEELISAEDVRKEQDHLELEIDECGDSAAISSMEHQLGNSLDQIMKLLFGYIDCHSEDPNDSMILYRKLLGIFDNFILPTYKCLHIQYLMFYICSKRPLFADNFIDSLWRKIESPNTPVIFRQISAYYLGSLLSRAKYIPIGTVKDALSLMCRYLHNYVAQITSVSSLSSDFSKHITFYSVCQSVLYTIAFLHKEIVESNEGLDFLRNMNLEQIITSPMNPLKVIYPTLCSNFANVSRHYQIVYCHSIIEKNRRGALPTSTQKHAAQQLDMYFPFDPYVLLESKTSIEPLYRNYVDHLNGMREIDNSEAESDSDDSLSYETEKRKNGMSFSYSTSPGFKYS